MGQTEWRGHGASLHCLCNFLWINNNFKTKRFKTSKRNTSNFYAAQQMAHNMMEPSPFAIWDSSLKEFGWLRCFLSFFIYINWPFEFKLKKKFNSLDICLNVYEVLLSVLDYWIWSLKEFITYNYSKHQNYMTESTTFYTTLRPTSLHRLVFCQPLTKLSLTGWLIKYYFPV